jgi:murein DD-endopeptidase MepM/ murein hydrolase activator NlpD
MKQQYFILVLAHSFHGRLRRIHIPHHVVYTMLAFALLGCITFVGFVTSYVRMAWKTSNYNSLRAEMDSLRGRYQKLLKDSEKQNNDLATFQMFAKEVSAAYSIQSGSERAMGTQISEDSSLLPSVSESLQEYNTLQSATFSLFSRDFMRKWHTNTRPSLWPVAGRLLSHFGERDDPFSGEPAFHPGVDISAPMGTPVRATADGIVVRTGWFGGYGQLIVIDHGKLQTYYAHLSRIDVIPGQEVRRGEFIGASGETGRAQAPHLHYEVRVNGAPVNPYQFLAHAAMASNSKAGSPGSDLPF